MSFWFYMADGMQWPLNIALVLFSFLLISFVIGQDKYVRDSLKSGKYTREQLTDAASRVRGKMLRFVVVLIIASIACRAYVKANKPVAAERAP